MDLAKLRAVFIGEADGLLTRLEQALLTAEKNPKDADALRTIFQVMHTLKGNAATMGFGRMAELAHHLEDVMEPIKEGKRSLTLEWVDFLLQSLDLLRTLLQQYQEGKESEAADIRPTLARINTMLGAPAEPAHGSKEKPSSTASAAQPSPKSPAETAAVQPPAPVKEKPKVTVGAVQEEAKALPTATVRVQLKHLDNMMNLVSELT